MTTPRDIVASAIDQAVNAINTIPDPIAREKAARDLLDDLKLIHPTTIKAARRRAVEELKGGRTLQEVGNLLGGLTRARVEQILKDK
ncbi:hypothetical protein ACWEPB_02630 [Kitasatospora cineracea]